MLPPALFLVFIYTGLGLAVVYGLPAVESDMALQKPDPWLGECVICGMMAEGFPVPVFLPRDGTYLTCHHLCLSCHYKTQFDKPLPNAPRRTSPQD